METDNQLLARYAGQDSQAAFRELVERHINVVHSAAWRESGGDAPMAEDITQAVFTELARHAGKLARHPALAGWLYTCVRRMSANVRRAESRRLRREQESLTMNQILASDPSDKLWQQVRPVLDDVMHELNDQDRAAVVLRFFEGRNHKEVGAALGLTENAARMRVERSLDKLRELLSRRGVHSTASTLAAVLVVGAAMQAPSALAATVAASAMASAAASATFTLASLLGALLKPKIAAMGALLVLVSAVSIHYFSNAQNAMGAGTASAPAALPADSTASTMSNGTSVRAIVMKETAHKFQMSVQVVEAETGAPLPHAKLLLAYLRQDGRGKDIHAVTDESGRLGVDAPQSPFHYLNMFVTADGHVPKVTTFGSAPAPAEYTMPLERGVTIGGTIADESGRPIAGAKIQFDGPGNNEAQSVNMQFGPDTATKSDTNGHWTCNMVPKDLDHLSVFASHPDYADAQTSVQPNSPDATNANITMKPGLAVTGVVQDTQGQPVAGAKVRIVRPNGEGETSKMSDATGAFALNNLQAGELVLSVQAQGFAPAVRTLAVTSAVTALQFKLAPGQLLRGHVVDERGRPVTNAWVETLRTTMRKVIWQTWVDASGQFAWDSAPTKSVEYSVEAEGYIRLYALKLAADGSDHEIVLTRNKPGQDTIQITGTALDAATGQPLDTFKVSVARIDPDWAAPFAFAANGKDGQFTYTSHAGEFHTNYQLQVEKEGYLPGLTNLSVKNGNQAVELKLQRGAGPSGVVHLPGGEPAANAAVYLCTPQMGVKIGATGKVVESGLNSSTYSAQTDFTGKFTLPAAASLQGIIVLHEQGFAQIALSAMQPSNNIALQPWGWVEGIAYIGGHPASNQTITAYHQVASYDEHGRRFGLLSYGLEAKTDAHGAFSIEKVPPGECNLHGASSRRYNVTVNSGAATRVSLGGDGRTVIGTAQLGGATGPGNCQGAQVVLRSKKTIEAGPFPQRHEFSSNQAFIEAVSLWEQATRGAQNFSASSESDGTFRLIDVPAGTYVLTIKLQEQPEFVDTTYRRLDLPEIASLEQEVIVPAVPEGQPDEGLDLGPLVLTPKQTTALAQ